MRGRSIPGSWGMLCVVFLLSAVAGSAGGQEVATGVAKAGAGLPGVIAPRPKGTAETLTSLSLAGSDLRAAPPLLGGKAAFPEFIRESLRVQWRAGDPIDLYVIRPVSVQKPRVVLFLYGFPSETDRFRNNEFCKIVTRGGFAAVGFVSALTGPRYHDRPMREWFVSELQESLVSTVHDVQMILNYLSTRNDLDMNQIGMFGQGSGGTIAILAAAQDPRIKALDVLDPWGDWPDWMAQSRLIPEEERSDYLNPDFLKRVAPFDPLVWVRKLGSRPVRLQNALYEKDTPRIAKQRIESALPRTTQVVHYEDVQAFSRNAIADGKMVNWIKEQLKAGPSKDRDSGKAKSKLKQTAWR